MAPPTAAESEAHTIARETTDAILSTGIGTIVIAGLALLLSIYSAWRNWGADEKRREKANEEDQKSRDTAKKEFDSMLKTLRKDLDKLREDFDAEEDSTEKLPKRAGRKIRLEIAQLKATILRRDSEIRELKDQLGLP